MDKKTEADTFLKHYVTELKKICGKNLKAVIVTGSVSKDDNIKGWSDIDLAVVLDSYDPKQLIAIGNLDKAGIMAVSLEDWKKKILNPKIKYALANKYKIIYGKVAMPHIKVSEISGDFKTIAVIYHDDLIKCATRGMNQESAKKSIKFVFLLCKVVAREFGLNLAGYSDCIDFCRKQHLDYKRLKSLDDARKKWLKVTDYSAIIEQALEAGEEIFQYGKKLF